MLLGCLYSRQSGVNARPATVLIVTVAGGKLQGDGGLWTRPSGLEQECIQTQLPLACASRDWQIAKERID